MRVEGRVPVRFALDVRAFEHVNARFDGRNFWFDGVDDRQSPATASFLRDSLDREVSPEGLERSGLTRFERAAYASTDANTFRVLEKRT